MKMDEQVLICRVKEGDEEAFAEIMRRYKHKIVNYLWQFSGDYQRAVDLAQETFMRVYFKADKYKPIAPLSSWIYAIASNLAKTDAKKSRRFSLVSLDDIQNIHKEGAYYSENPEKSAVAKKLREAIDLLHPRYRLPLILKDIEGFSQEEIAEILDKPVGTIKARISRGRNYLKQELEKNSINPHITKKEELVDGRT